VSAPVFVLDGVALRDGETVVLDGAEGRHAATVQRLGVGERLVVTDGRGTSADATVTRADRDRLEVAIARVVSAPSPQPRLVVVQALAKGERGELAVATMTEVGVDVIVPWAAARSVARWEGARGDKALARWRATARESAKQSRRSHFPEVTGLVTTREVTDLLRVAALAVVLHEEATSGLGDTSLPSAGDVVLVVGPEGGISEAELAAFDAAGASPRRLGPTVLRTSTAGSVAAAVLLSRTARWLT
jgi:16S rRNA (uracil1498-N3)-methyltransferase